jgi:hypothetical protein
VLGSGQRVFLGLSAGMAISLNDGNFVITSTLLASSRRFQAERNIASVSLKAITKNKLHRNQIDCTHVVDNINIATFVFAETHRRERRFDA